MPRSQFACMAPLFCCLLTSILLAMFACACGGGKHSAPEPESPEGLILSSRSASVRILPETYLAGGSARAITLTEREEGGDVLLELRAQEAQQLKALYLHLEYDPEQLSPAGVESAWAFAAEQDTLQLSLAGAAGVLEYGEQCIRPQEADQSAANRGLSGDGLLATIRLARRPFAAEQRQALAPTIAQRSQSILSLDVDSFTLSWGYASNGDYNQNGTVAVTDLTPIGAHFGEDVPDEDQSTIQSVIDGNGDGQIGVADLTAIGLNFQISVNSYNIYAANNIAAVPTSNGGPNGAGAELRGTVPFDQIQGDQFSARRSFSFALPVSQIGWFYWVRPNDALDGGGADGTPSSVVSFGGKPNNLDPEAAISVDPASGGKPLEVTLDASASSDPDGLAGDISDIVQFQWDFDGNGVVDDVSSEPSVTHTYHRSGAFAPRVTVFDAGAAFASASTSLAVGVLGNNTPVAILEASLTSGEAPMTVFLDASQSHDGDEQRFSLRHEWDFDGDGVFDLDTGFVKNTTHVYTEAGTFEATLRVRDEAALIAITSVTIEVAENQGNLPPVAELQPDPLQVDVATPNSSVDAVFEISDSTDPDGAIVRAELDVDSNGVFEAVFVSIAGSEPDTLTARVRPGISTASLKVIDNLGAQSVDTIEVQVTVLGNLPPIALLEADTLSGQVPLTVNFDASGSSDIDGSISTFRYRIGSEDEFDDPDGLVSHTFENGGTFFVQLKVIDDGGLETRVTKTVEVTDPANQPPTAAFSMDRSSGQAPLTISFDPSASQDADGSIATYEWDFEGDGVFAPVDTRTDALPFTQSIMQGGTREISLRVTDNDGASDVSTQSVSVSGGWKFGTISTSFRDSRITSTPVSLTALPSGEPGLSKAGLAFFNGNFGVPSPDSILYTEAGPADLLNWVTPVPVTVQAVEGLAEGTFGFEVALVDAAGHPGVAFNGDVFANGQFVEGGILFARAEDPQGSAWPASFSTIFPHVVNEQVFQPSIALVDGHPAVCVRRNANNSAQIIYSRAQDAAGSAWGNAVPVYDQLPGESVGLSYLLVPADGTPGVIFSAGATGDESPFYSRAFDSLGLGWEAPQLIEDGTGRNLRSGDRMSAAIANGNPTAVYPNNGGVFFVERSASVAGDFAAPSVEVTSSTFTIPALISAAGRPCLVYGARRFNQKDSASSEVIYFQAALDPDATAWGPPVIVTSVPLNSLTLTRFERINNDLVILYNDESATSLNVAVFEDFAGL